MSGSILGVILIGTLWMELRSIPWYVASASLIVTLLASWLVPTYLLLSRDGPVRLAPSAAYVGAPIFFDAACFGLRFQQRRRVDIMFGWNLIGAVARGGWGSSYRWRWGSGPSPSWSWPRTPARPATGQILGIEP